MPIEKKRKNKIVKIIGGDMVKAKKRFNKRTILKKDENDRTQKERHYLIKKQMEKCDEIFSLYIRYRDRKCVLCSSVEDLQCSHYFTKKSHSSVRWYEINAHAMCDKCHCRHHNQGEHEYAMWMLDKYGRDMIDFLEQRAYSEKSYTLQELCEIENMYKEKVRKMEAMQ